ncbi:MAG: DUF5661 family protein [Candidatus Anammoxibacter sp.]
MPLSEHVSVDEVKRVCKELGFKDWSSLKEPEVSDDESAKILKLVNTIKMNIAVEDFKQGLEVELEHGTRYVDANITNNHPILTGKIVLAHLKESIDYYKRIDVAEIEGDLLQAILSKNLAKIESKYQKLIEARNKLNEAITNQIRDSGIKTP